MTFSEVTKHAAYKRSAGISPGRRGLPLRPGALSSFRGKEEDTMKVSAISFLVLCVSLSATVEVGAQTPVGALAIDERRGDQWGWAVDYETADAARATALGGVRRGLLRGADVRALRGVCGLWSLVGRPSAACPSRGGRASARRGPCVKSTTAGAGAAACLWTLTSPSPAPGGRVSAANRPGAAAGRTRNRGRRTINAFPPRRTPAPGSASRPAAEAAARRLQNRSVVHDPVDDRGGGRWVEEDLGPARERQVWAISATMHAPPT